MYEDSWYVDTVGTGHTVLAVVAGDVLQPNNLLSHLAVQVFFLLFSQRLQRAVGQKVILQVFHIGHAAEHGEHALRRSGIAEGPRGHRPLEVLLLQFGHQVLRQLHQSPAEQRFHNDGGYAALLQFGIEVAGIDIALVNLVSKVPVQIIQLYLAEVPVIFIVPAEHLVEH